MIWSPSGKAPGSKLSTESSSPKRPLATSCRMTAEVNAFVMLPARVWSRDEMATPRRTSASPAE